MSEHKFKVGQVVEYHPPRGLIAERRQYIVTAALPAQFGVFEYRIRHPSENYERIATEHDLREVEANADPSHRAVR